MTEESALPDSDEPGEARGDQRRGIRSYVLRQGRMSDAQTRAYETLLPRYGLATDSGTIDFTQAFNRDAPTVFEIGFGMGETTAAIAHALPDKNFLGVEVHLPGVGALLKLVEQMQLTNVRVIRHDAVEVLKNNIADASLAGCHIYFPDPWHKKRHNKRRLVQRGFLDVLIPKLKLGGYIHFATDWEDYAHWALAELAAHPHLRNQSAHANGFADRPSYRPVTKFEKRGQRLGHGVWDLVFERSSK
jgi:tRNA (guanine-N7-)-methyltransferase